MGGSAGAAPGAPAAAGDTASSPVIILGAAGGHFDQEAGSELRRYLHAVTGSLPRIAAISAEEDAPAPASGPQLLVGEQADNPALASLVADGALPDKAHAPGSDGYVVKTVTYRGAQAVAVMGSSPIGTLYGAYRLLEQYGVRFYIDQDALPPLAPFTVAQVDLAEQPAVSHRGLLPWFDYLNGPSAFSLPDFKSYIDQMVKMRMNTLMLHDYMGGYPGSDIDEPFMSFTCNGKSFNGYLDTSVSNQRWGLASTTASQMAFRSGEYLPYQILGSDAARYTAGQPDAQLNTFRKAQDMMRQIIDYGADQGVDVVLGTDFNLLPKPLTDAGCNPLDPDVLRARLDAILDTYPKLKYIQMYMSEGTPVTTGQSIQAYQVLQAELAAKRPGAQLITGGWSDEQLFPQMDSALPKNIVFSTLTPYDMTVQPQWAQVAKNRQAWAVPWMEFDGGMLEPQLAVERMQQQLPQLRAAGVDGIIGLLWRERPDQANIAYLAQDAWQSVGHAFDATAFYRDYAAHTLGPAAADAGAQAFSALEHTGVYGAGLYGHPPTTPNAYAWTLCSGGVFCPGDQDAAARQTDYGGAEAQFQALAPDVTSAAGRDDLDYWIQFMRWMQYYWKTNQNVPQAMAEAFPKVDNYFLVNAGSSQGEKDLLPDSGYYSTTNTADYGGTVTNDFGYPQAMQSVRYAYSTFGYRFTVPPQYTTYRVELYFAEIAYGVIFPGDPVGQRVFNIAINGNTVQQNFDVAKAAGGSLKGVKLTFDVPVTNNSLDISFIPVVGQPAVNAIRAYPIDSAGNPVPPHSPPSQPVKAWDDLTHSGIQQAIGAYEQTVRGVPDLGGLVSVAGGGGYFPTFTSDEARVAALLPAAPPSDIEGYGTRSGARVTWQPGPGTPAGITGYNVWRAPPGSDQFTKVTATPVKGTSFSQDASGSYQYAVTTVLADGTESPQSFAVPVEAGAADHTPPHIVMPPQPDHPVAGEGYPVTATVVDGREPAADSATLHYRRLGTDGWHTAVMRPNVTGQPGTFYGVIPGAEMTTDGTEYYVTAADGTNTKAAPPGAPDSPRSVSPIPAPGPRPQPAGQPAVAVDSTAHTVSCTLGASNSCSGLAQQEFSGDGVTQAVQAGGESARQTVQVVQNDLNMYFNVDDSIAHDGSYTAKFTVQYFDQGTSTWSLQYDGTNPNGGPQNGAYSTAGQVQQQNTGTWKTATFTVPDARFANSENGGTDFRITSAAPVTIHDASVDITTPPAAMVNWQQPTSTPVSEYRVYRGTTPGFQPGPDTYLTYVTAEQQSFRDLEVQPGHQYCYRIVAVSATGRTAPPSPTSACVPVPG